jgi:hypothetical protein
MQGHGVQVAANAFPGGSRIVRHRLFEVSAENETTESIVKEKT